MARCAVRIDHICILRTAGGGTAPDPVRAALLAELAGVHAVEAHVRRDRRHIQDRDVYLMKQILSAPLRLAVVPSHEMVHFAVDVLPAMVTFTAEKREDETFEGGINIRGMEKEIASLVETLSRSGIRTGACIDPEAQQVKSAKRAGVSFVELYTGHFAHANSRARQEELSRLQDGAYAAYHAGLAVHAGHGLTYQNIRPVAEIEEIHEVTVGHACIDHALTAGIDTAIRDLISITE